MRILPQGPHIPDKLLEARDQGDVIFLCGAGASQPDLPGFASLARQVINASAAPVTRPHGCCSIIEQGRMINAPVDEVFQNMKYDYAADAIDQLVTSLLSQACGAIQGSVESNVTAYKIKGTSLADQRGWLWIRRSDLFT